MTTILTALTAAEAFRGFLVLALPLADDKVMYAAQEIGPEAGRPTMPYLTVQWSRSAELSSTPFVRVGDAVAPADPDGLTNEHIIQQARQGVVQVIGYGESAPTLLEQLPLLKAQLTEQKYLNDEGIAVRPLGDVLDTRELRDTSWEPSALQEWAVTYAVEVVSRIGTIKTVTVPLTINDPEGV